MAKNSNRKEFNPNPEQKAVIESQEKHLLVVAGAGSGKTATMVERICDLIMRRGAKPQSILGLTFTRKASHELAKRAADKLKEEEDKLQGSIRVQTYDSFIQGIVKQYGLLIGVDPQMVPLSDAGISQCVAKVLENNYEKINASFGEIENIDSDFSLHIYPLAQAYNSKNLQDAVKKFTAQTLNFLVDENHLDFQSAAKEAEKWSKDWHDSLEGLNAESGQDEEKKRINQLLCNAKLRELIIDLSLQYAQLREENNLAEYGDFTLYALKLIHDYPSIAEEYRKKFRYIFLDEYQDTNHTQGILLKLLFENGPMVTAVGDPQQAIYGFRGTTPGAFDYFKSAFKNVKQLDLPETFRNKKNIVDLANHITERLPEKDRLSLRSREEKEGGKVCALIYKNKEGQNEEMGPKAALEFITQKRKEDPNGTIAILGRDNQDLIDYQKILDKNKIPCILTGKSEFDNENPIARDFREILAVATDPFASRQAEDLLLSPRYSFSLQDMRKVAGEVSSQNRGMNPDKDKEHPDPVFTLPIYLRSLNETQIRDLGLSAKDAEADRESGSEILSRFVRNIKSVEFASFAGLETVATEAWKVLDLNADVAIADELLGSLPYEKLTLEDALDAVKTYKADLESDQSPTVQGFLGWIENYRKDFRPKDSGEGQSKEVQPPVELMTIHQAKGLEWDTVIIVGMQNDLEKQNKDKDSPDKFKKGEIPKVGNESMWIDSPDAAPANLRTDLEDFDKNYAKACQSFNNPSQLSSDSLLRCLKDLYREEINRDIQEEAHVAYVAMTRPKGDLLLISQSRYNLFSTKDGIANIRNHGGLFWSDAVKFILGSDGEFEGKIQDEVKKHDNFAVFSNDEGLKDLIEKANQNGEDEEEEIAKNWPVQIREDIREILQKSAQKVKDASEEGNDGDLYRRSKNLIAYEKSQKEARKELVDKLNLVSTTELQKLSINGGDLKDFIRPLPSAPSDAAEAGTEFHAWVATYLLDPSEAEKVRINERYEKEISCWQRTFECSDWSKRTCWGTEIPYCISLDRKDSGKIVVTAKLDAVFKGDLDGNREEENLTIVDWKTGKSPTCDKAKERLLRQLDIYRLALSRVTHRDIESIHACLYFVSDGGRQIEAADKGEKEIENEILEMAEGKL